MRGPRPFGGAFAGKTVLVTGHTGFKGAWLSLWLKDLGAKVVGYSLPPDPQPNLYDQLKLGGLVESRFGDIRELGPLEDALRKHRPDIVFHLAAQSLVRRSYENPAETFATNVQGTVNLLEAVRRTPSVRVCQVITSDKCYENREWDYAYRENDRVGGHDPYSASKACAELAAASYRSSFFPAAGTDHRGVSLSSARAGNVIGGGDWARDRIIPDCIRALTAGKPILVRNPKSIRPWQFVLEPLSGYLHLCSRQLENPSRYAQAFNFGPMNSANLTVAEVADRVVRAWGSGRWTSPGSAPGSAPHEAKILKLDCAKSHDMLRWRPVYDAEQSIAKTVAWYRKAAQARFDALEFTRAQIQEYASAAREAGHAWAAAPAGAAKRRSAAEIAR